MVRPYKNSTILNSNPEVYVEHVRLKCSCVASIIPQIK
jgi:hypothetical protein